MCGCRRADGPAESSPAGFPGASSRCAWPEKKSVRMLQQLKPVALAYAHRIEDVGRESDLASMVILPIMATSVLLRGFKLA